MNDVTFDISEQMVLEVFQEWNANHPGCKAQLHMTEKEFADAMMAKVLASMRVVSNGGNA